MLLVFVLQLVLLVNPDPRSLHCMLPRSFAFYLSKTGKGRRAITPHMWPWPSMNVLLPAGNPGSDKWPYAPEGSGSYQATFNIFGRNTTWKAHHPESWIQQHWGIRCSYTWLCSDLVITALLAEETNGSGSSTAQI